jgi:hypothetical protein
MVDWRSDDRELLARILTAEAGNQGPIGMTAAGNVIMNRANTPGYGDGVRGVIMKPGQFSPMNSVTGYARGEQGQDIDALRPTETAYMVADSLLQGTAGDITGGATHFFNPDISNPSWAQGKDFTRIGDHVFGRADAGRDTTSNTGATAMWQSTMTQGQPAPMPQEQQQQPSFIRGLLTNPDFLDSLAIGLGGLTLEPNQALMQLSANRIAGRRQERQDTAATNRTVEYLRSQGRDDLADAVASGSLSGKDAAAIMFQEPKERGQILSAAQMREMFPGAQIEDGLYNLKADGTANKVGGGGTTINMPGEPLKVLPDGRIVIADPAAPDGFRAVTPPGTAAAQEAQTAQVDKEAQLASAQSSLELINSVLNSDSLESVTGMIQGRLPAMSQSGTDLVTRIEQLQGQAFLQAFESLKGGGSITEIEGQAATNAIARLNRAQSAEAFREGLRDLQEIYQRAVERANNGGAAAPATGNTINGVTVGEPY